jgi:hypothetical protein
MLESASFEIRGHGAFIATTREGGDSAAGSSWLDRARFATAAGLPACWNRLTLEARFAVKILHLAPHGTRPSWGISALRRGRSGRRQCAK